MPDKTNIEWTDATWNPLRGCSRVSGGCRHCYAEGVAARIIAMDRGRGVPEGEGSYDGLLAKGGQWNGQVKLVHNLLDQPLRWTKPRKIFVNSMSDLFHESVPFDYIASVFNVMAFASWHIFQVLTKRPRRALEFFAWLEDHPERPVYDCQTLLSPGTAWQPLLLAAHFGPSLPKGYKLDIAYQWPMPNVWLGVSVEDQASADERIPVLLEAPAAVHWLSMEPLLGPVNLLNIEDQPGLRRIDWVVVGGESGPNARPMHPDWARAIRDQCEGACVPFLFKQWGEWVPGENVQSTRGIVRTASLVNGEWHFGEEDLTREGGNVDDEPDLYRMGKKNAGRLLDGRIYDGYVFSLPIIPESL
jgi:protein gp37